jgi:predicted dehydrogenase
MAYRATPFHYDLPDGLVKIVGVADVNPNSTEAASKHLDCEVWTMNYRELLNQKDVEVDGIYEPSSTRQIP